MMKYDELWNKIDKVFVTHNNIKKTARYYIFLSIKICIDFYFGHKRLGLWNNLLKLDKWIAMFEIL